MKHIARRPFDILQARIAQLIITEWKRGRILITSPRFFSSIRGTDVFVRFCLFVIPRGKVLFILPRGSDVATPRARERVPFAHAAERVFDVGGFSANSTRRVLKTPLQSRLEVARMYAALFVLQCGKGLLGNHWRSVVFTKARLPLILGTYRVASKVLGIRKVRADYVVFNQFANFQFSGWVFLRNRRELSGQRYLSLLLGDFFAIVSTCAVYSCRNFVDTIVMQKTVWG